MVDSLNKWSHDIITASTTLVDYKTAPYRQRVDRFLAEHGVFPRVIMEMDSFRSAKQMVMQNLGVTFLPKRTFLQE